MGFTVPRSLGTTHLNVGRLGIASSYGAPAKAYEEAFEKGCNYFVWNSFMKGRSSKIPEGETPLKASDCYRFALSNPNVDICLTGPKTLEQMQENLRTLELGPLSEKEIQRIRDIGKYIYRKK